MGLQVRAHINTEEGVVVGYYAGHRRREGEVFEIAKPKDFSHRWMEAIDWTPPPPTGPQLPPPGEATAVLLDEKHTFENSEGKKSRKRKPRNRKQPQSEGEPSVFS